MVTQPIIATTPEIAVYRALKRLKIDFDFQSKMLGGYGEKGSTRADFSIPSLNLIISVIGEYWHYAFRSTMIRDRLQQTALESSGVRVEYIDATDALRNATFFVTEALRGVSHSKFGSL